MKRKSFVKSVVALVGSTFLPLPLLASKKDYKLTVHKDCFRKDVGTRLRLSKITKGYRQTALVMDSSEIDGGAIKVGAGCVQILVPAFEVATYPQKKAPNSHFAQSRHFLNPTAQELRRIGLKKVDEHIDKLIKSMSEKGYKDIHLFLYNQNSLRADEPFQRMGVVSYKEIGLVGLK